MLPQSLYCWEAQPGALNSSVDLDTFKDIWKVAPSSAPLSTVSEDSDYGFEGLSGNGVELSHLEDDDPFFETDDFRMWDMKVLPCGRTYAHDWTTCPFAHSGEKAVRRNPETHHYTGVACPDMRRLGNCRRSDRCPYAHNVFEYWLHPTRYRTQLCNDGPNCHRRPCFFAHSLGELRTPEARAFVTPEMLAAADRAAAEPAAARRAGSACSPSRAPPAGLAAPGRVRRLQGGSCQTVMASLSRDRGCTVSSPAEQAALARLLAALKQERGRQHHSLAGNNHAMVLTTLQTVLQRAVQQQRRAGGAVQT